MSKSPSTVLSLKTVRRSFEQGGKTLDILKGCNLEIKAGEVVALLGPSGSGKSTMLQICGLLENPTSGQILIDGNDSSQMNDKERTKLRQSTVGFVYQSHHLLPEFSALENVIIPQMIAGKSKKEAALKSEELLAMVGLSGRTSHRPARLSGGEQQRVAIARALANSPALLLADEPTGNLDPETADSVFDLLMSRAKDAGLAALIATHNHDLAARMDRVISLKDGLLT